MELNTAAEHSPICNAPNGNVSHILKDTVQSLRHHNGNVQESCEKPEVDKNVMVDLGLSSKSKDMEDSSVSVLKGEYCGLATQVSIEYVDIFEILRAEILAAEAREFEVIENELLGTDRRGEFEDGKKGEESTSTSVMGNDRPTSASPLPLGQDEEHKQMDGSDNPKCNASSLPEAQRNQENGQVPFESSDTDSRDADRAGPDKGNVDPSDISKDGDGDESVQKIEGEGLALSKDDKDSTWQNEEDTCKNGEKANSVEDEGSNILVVEVIGDAYSRDATDDTSIGERNLEPKDIGKGEDGDGQSQSDKYSEHSDEEEHAPGPFSGPIAFSGMLSYSGMISYSGQIPYSGNLSLHSDSSTSTRSFAFPILASEWNSSPAKIGPPDSRYFRRRRRWRPRFCCRRPTTLFD